jgi:hypothetical protein
MALSGGGTLPGDSLCNYVVNFCPGLSWLQCKTGGIYKGCVRVWMYLKIERSILVTVICVHTYLYMQYLSILANFAQPLHISGCV